MSDWTSDERWDLRAKVDRPTIIVTEMGPCEHRRRKAKIKKGARIVPFGFSRALDQEDVSRDPLLWEGDQA